MTYLKQDLAVAQILALMSSYSFETNQNSVEEIVRQWQKHYSVHWIYLATIEALYLGRYKAISVEQIMYSWSRMGQPKTHFGGEFERLISRKLPRHFDIEDSETAAETTANFTEQSLTEDYDTLSFPTEEETKTASTTEKDLTKSIDRDRSTMQREDSAQLNKADSSNSDRAMPIFTQVTPVPDLQVSISSSAQELTDSEEDCSSTGIRIFQPRPDASGFFQKLKALADSQRNNKQ